MGVLYCKWVLCVFVILVFIIFVLVQLVTSIASVVHNVTRTAFYVFIYFSGEIFQGLCRTVH